MITVMVGIELITGMVPGGLIDAFNHISMVLIILIQLKLVAGVESYGMIGKEIAIVSSLQRLKLIVTIKHK